MAGKKGQKGGGGARKGAGRPKIKKRVSEKVKAAFIKASRELADEYGEPLEMIALRLIYDDKTQDSVKVAIFKVYKDALVVNEKKVIVKDKEPFNP
jgi:hypothetical protein